VLISSSSLSSATWQTAPIHNSPQIAQSVHSENGSASPAQPANSPAAQSSEHTASDRAQQTDATGAEAPHPVTRRGQSKIQDSQTADTSAANGQAPVLANNTPPLPFQAVLNDLLPQLTEQATPSPLAKQAANPPADAPLGQDLGKTPVDQVINGRAPAVPQTRTVALDPGFQITRQSVPAGVPNDLNQKLANNELAFAARVVQRAGIAATVALRDTQTVISASRLDAAKPGATADGNPQATLTVKKSDAAAPPTKAPAEQSAQPASASELAGGDSSNHESDSQRETGPTDITADLRPTGESQQGATAMQPVQQSVTGISTPAPASTEVGAHNATSAKTAEPGAPQMLEPHDELAGRAGESVHNISLRLSNAEQGSVQVRLSERAGELHVSVRTPDTGLTRGLRDGLPDLMGRLQVSGYRADTWQPGGNGSHAGQDRGQDAAGHGSSHERNGGGSQQQSSPEQQQHQDEQTPQWVRELESSIQRSNSQWAAAPTR